MTFANGRARDFLWISVALAVIAVFFTTVYLRSRPGPAEQIASKAQRMELVHAVRTALAAVSEAQNSAVMSSADQDTQYFVAQARAANADLEHDLKELATALKIHANEQQLELLNQVQQAFAEFERLDNQLLPLAAQNSNRKAYALAIGPSAKVLQELEAVLAHMVADHEKSTSDNAQRIVQLGNETRIAVLRIQVLLLPHIAEERDNRMDELEAQIATEDQKIIQNMDSLSELLESSDASGIAKAKSLYAEFDKLRTQILKLSRENTNLRSLALTLTEKRKAMLAAEDSLAALEDAIQSEEIVTTIPFRR